MNIETKWLLDCACTFVHVQFLQYAVDHVFMNTNKYFMQHIKSVSSTVIVWLIELF